MFLSKVVYLKNINHNMFKTILNYSIIFIMNKDDTIITLFKKGCFELKIQYNKPNIQKLTHIFGIGYFFLALAFHPITKMKGAWLIIMSMLLLYYRYKTFEEAAINGQFFLDVLVIIPLFFVLGFKRNIGHLKHLASILGIGYIVYYGKQLVLNN